MTLFILSPKTSKDSSKAKAMSPTTSAAGAGGGGGRDDYSIGSGSAAESSTMTHGSRSKKKTFLKRKLQKLRHLGGGGGAGAGGKHHVNDADTVSLTSSNYADAAIPHNIGHNHQQYGKKPPSSQQPPLTEVRESMEESSSSPKRQFAQESSGWGRRQEEEEEAEETRTDMSKRRGRGRSPPPPSNYRVGTTTTTTTKGRTSPPPSQQQPQQTHAAYESGTTTTTNRRRKRTPPPSRTLPPSSFSRRTILAEGDLGVSGERTIGDSLMVQHPNDGKTTTNKQQQQQERRHRSTEDILSESLVPSISRKDRRRSVSFDAIDAKTMSSSAVSDFTDDVGDSPNNISSSRRSRNNNGELIVARTTTTALSGQEEGMPIGMRQQPPPAAAPDCKLCMSALLAKERFGDFERNIKDLKSKASSAAKAFIANPILGNDASSKEHDDDDDDAIRQNTDGRRQGQEEDEDAAGAGESSLMNSSIDSAASWDDDLHADAYDSPAEMLYDAKVRFNLGEINLRNENIDAAYDNLTKGLKARILLRGPFSEDTAVGHERVGDVQALRGRYEKAHHHYNAALNIYMLGDQMEVNSGGGGGGSPKATSSPVRSHLHSPRTRGNVPQSTAPGHHHHDTILIKERQLKKASCDILLKKAKLYAKTKNKYDALYNFAEAISGLKLLEGETSKAVTDVLLEMGQLAQDCGDDDAAYGIYEEATENKSVQEAEEHGEDFPTVYFTMGKLAAKRGDYDAALTHLELALRTKRSTLGVHPDVYRVLQYTGFVHYQRGELDEAISCYNEALGVMRVTVFDCDSAHDITSNLELIYRKMDRVDLVLQIYKDVVGGTIKVFGTENNCAVAWLFHKIGQVALELDKPKEAIRYYKREGKVRSAIGSDPKEVVKLLMDIGTVHRKSGNWDAALKHFFESMNLLAKTLPPELRTNLSRVSSATSTHSPSKFPRQRERNATGNISSDGSGSVGDDGISPTSSGSQSSPSTPDEDQREFCIIDTLLGCEKVLGSQDFTGFILPVNDFTDMVNDMGNVLLLQGHHTKAIQCYQGALRIKSGWSVYDEEEYLRTRYNLGHAYFRANRLDEASDVFNSVLAEQESLVGEDSLEVANTLNQIANIHLVRGSCISAMNLYKRSLSLKRRILDEHDPELTGTMVNLGLSYFRMGSFHKALPLFEKVLELRKESHGHEHLHVAETMKLIGNVHMHNGDIGRAIEKHMWCLCIRESALDEDDPLIGMTHTNLAAVHLTCEDYDDCHGRCLKAMDVFRKAQLKPDHKYMQQLKRVMLQLDRALARIQMDRDEKRATNTMRRISRMVRHNPATTIFSL